MVLRKLRIINYELRIGLHQIINILQKINHKLFFNDYLFYLINFIQRIFIKKS